MNILIFVFVLHRYTCVDREGDRGPDPPPPPPEKSHKYRVSSQCWSGSHENHKAAKPAFNVGPSSARQRNAIYGSLIVVFRSSLPLSTKKITSKLDTPDKTFWIRACYKIVDINILLEGKMFRRARSK